ncbi:MAG: OmpA family protein [Blastocatellia bacterium]|nr:OmpA family protein [Blastocatellia bacterium]
MSAKRDLETKESKQIEQDVNSQDEFTQLRSLLLGSEQAQIAKISDRLDNHKTRAEEISHVLADAINQSSKRDQQLTESLLPTVEEAIRISVKKDARILVDALFPVIGPAIRKAISQALSGMLQSLNQTLDQSFSWKGLLWRIEAFRTGKSFAEVVLLKTLLYRVEQLFLIHRESGLLLQHVVADLVVAQDADMVSAMFTAIQDFVKDSFGVKEGETLQTLQIGELNVWVEQGPKATLAAVIRGDAPADLRNFFQDAIEMIHFHYQDALEGFSGDASVFEPSRKTLEDCLQAQYEKQTQGKFSPAFWIFVSSISFLILGWSFFYLRDTYRWKSYLDKLRTTNGIVITETGKIDGKYYVSGLRDPLAPDPDQILKLSKLNSEAVVSHWEAYNSLHPEFIIARTKQILAVPSGVDLRFENGTLHLTGRARHSWIKEARKLFRAIPVHLQESKLIDIDLEKLNSLKSNIEQESIFFSTGQSKPLLSESEKIEKLLANIKVLAKEATLNDINIELEVLGHSSSIGTDLLNSRLSQERAETVVAIFVRRGLEPKLFSVHAMAAKESDEQNLVEHNINQRVSFRVVLADI